MLPEHIREVLLRVGEVEWRALDNGTPERFGEIFQALVENTNKTHELEGPQTCHYVACDEGKLSIAMVGTSPNSGTIASIIAAGWNTMVKVAREEVQA
jgi:hypothetical protein